MMGKKQSMLSSSSPRSLLETSLTTTTLYRQLQLDDNHANGAEPDGYGSLMFRPFLWHFLALIIQTKLHYLVLGLFGHQQNQRDFSSKIRHCQTCSGTFLLGL